MFHCSKFCFGASLHSLSAASSCASLSNDEKSIRGAGGRDKCISIWFWSCRFTLSCFFSWKQQRGQALYIYSVVLHIIPVACCGLHQSVVSSEAGSSDFGSQDVGAGIFFFFFFLSLAQSCISKMLISCLFTLTAYVNPTHTRGQDLYRVSVWASDLIYWLRCF